MTRFAALALAAGLAGCSPVSAADVDASSDATTPLADARVDAQHADGSPDAATSCRSIDPFDSFAPVAGIKTTAAEQNAWLSHDELTVIFGRFTPGRKNDFFIASRAVRTDAFANVRPLSELNSLDQEYRAFMSDDGLNIFFDRQDSSTGYHILTAVRSSPAAQFGAAAPVASVNDMGGNYEPFLTPEGMYLGSERGGNLSDLFLAPRVGAGFGAPVRLGVSSSAPEEMPVVSSDGLTLYFAARDRDPAGQSWDVWMATRADLGQPFSAAALVNASNGMINQAGRDIPAWISDDDCRLYYTTDRDGDLDVWVASRTPH